MAVVYLGIGSNAGDREANIQKALGILKEHEDIDILATSAFIETDPVGGPPQEKFLNGAIKVSTVLRPLDLLTQLQIIERRMGRHKTEENGPRPMDLDILFYDDVVIVDGKNLCVPHPRVAERFFVLKPLSEIAPDLVHPRLGKRVDELLAALDENVQERAGT
jgi:2-amino-4-hydroxy-6-hydroxymethyldihydropteridine diphosphokinase